MRSCSRRPTGSSVNAVTTVVSRPKQRLRPRATLYSPPPSQTSKLRVVAMRRSPGSKRTMTSPRLTRSQRHCSFGLIFRGMRRPYRNELGSSQGNSALPGHEIVLLELFGFGVSFAAGDANNFLEDGFAHLFDGGFAGDDGAGVDVDDVGHAFSQLGVGR